MRNSATYWNDVSYYGNWLWKDFSKEQQLDSPALPIVKNCQPQIPNHVLPCGVLQKTWSLLPYDFDRIPASPISFN